ncbi:MAG TPA: hypothetical protein VNW97_11475 [Candidatus Saccharimonadales bacterium]|nr:hypothetical protein [Candidatus Saccharimonadales bacterium]
MFEPACSASKAAEAQAKAGDPGSAAFLPKGKDGDIFHSLPTT